MQPNTLDKETVDPQTIIDSIDTEFKFLKTNSTNVHYLEGFAIYLTKVLELLSHKPNIASKFSDSFYLKESSSELLLSLKKYSKDLKKLSFNLSHKNSHIRKATLEIMTKIQPYRFIEPEKGEKTPL